MHLTVMGDALAQPMPGSVPTSLSLEELDQHSAGVCSIQVSVDRLSRCAPSGEDEPDADLPGSIELFVGAIDIKAGAIKPSPLVLWESLWIDGTPACWTISISTVPNGHKPREISKSKSAGAPSWAAAAYLSLGLTKGQVPYERV
jgi:hypothetical protein